MDQTYLGEVVVLGLPLVAMVCGRLGWALFCARTRRGALRMLQFRLADVLLLFGLVGLLFAVLRRGPDSWLRAAWEILVGAPPVLYHHTGYYYDYYFIDYSPGFPGVFFLWAVLPLVPLIWLMIGEWLEDRCRKPPRARLVDFRWLEKPVNQSSPAENEQIDAWPGPLVVESSIGGLDGVTSDSELNCQVWFTYEAPAPEWPLVGQMAAGPGEQSGILVLEASQPVHGERAADGFPSGERIDYGNEF
jgi:hypothetical protein